MLLDCQIICVTSKRIKGKELKYVFHLFGEVEIISDVFQND